MRSKLTFALSIVALMAGMALAGPTAISDQPGDFTFQPVERDLIELFCQPVDEASYATASQYDTSYPFEAWVADDFYSDAGIAIDHMVFWGGFWNYSVWAQIYGTYVWIWEETGNCTPGYPYDGSELYYEYIDGANITATQTTGDYYMYEMDVPPFTPTPGAIYWISFQPALDFYDNGQWGIQMSLDYYNCPSMQLFPLLGTDPWTVHGNGDMAFCLYGQGTATTDSDWGAVKALY